MTQRVILQQIQGHCHTDTVVRTEAGTIGGQCLSIVDNLDGVLHRIVRYALFRHTDHIHMCLENHAGYVLTTGRGRLVDDDLVELIHFHLQAVILGPLAEIGADAFLVMRRTGDLGHFAEFINDDIQCFAHLIVSFQSFAKEVASSILIASPPTKLVFFESEYTSQ